MCAAAPPYPELHPGVVFEDGCGALDGSLLVCFAGGVGGYSSRHELLLGIALPRLSFGGADVFPFLSGWQ